MEVIAFVPLRGGSKSIPGKNIKSFCGKPLAYWNLNELQKSNFVKQIVVATDSEEIKQTVKNFKMSKIKVFDRTQKNSKDESSTESVMLEYINSSEININEVFMLVQVTNPFTKQKDYENGINLFVESEYDSVLSGSIFKRFLWEENGIPVNYDFNIRPRRQNFKGQIIENGAFYISSVKNILSSKNRLSGKIGIYKMPEYTSFEIDEPDDWHICEKLMKKYFFEKSKNNDIKLVVTDVDGVLTDAGMYYSNTGEELKKFNTHDGMAFSLLKKNGYFTGIVTSEVTQLVENRANKLNVDFLFQGKKNNGKKDAVQLMCENKNLTLEQVAYIGDDINCLDLLNSVGLAACPNNAVKVIKSSFNIIKLKKNGGEGVFREFVDNYILNEK